MSQFNTLLVSAELMEGWYEVYEDLVYESDVLGTTVIVPRGFQTNFASVPRVPIVYLAMGGRGNRAATIHDFLYTRSGVSKANADQVFREALKESGLPWWIYTGMYQGVKWGGKSKYQPKGETQ